ncbi:hypothetical protein TSOC_000505 [Tetrabaena socialis]|uniref:MSV199 domain-containing protein n=1 Tax=Tetrabaena socialis TaxID=47790 RepID=A0A2J8AJ36_9CHLO|nr:hypothetical protein TSOC_000505 [Tetrabaena socialis]|eukprot:PNH12536.1 hypothetical protein TSOC_000505 [Tetrabaena socialis]
MDLAMATHDEDLMALLRSELTGHEQQLFVTGFAAYLQYDPRKDFVVDLDDVYTWLGFTRKDSVKKLYTKHLTENVHYHVFRQLAETPLGGRFLLRQKAEQKSEPRGGSNKEQILLTIHGFKQLCMSANTEKGRRVREYYIGMEEILFEYTRRNAVKERERFNATIEEAKKEAEEAKKEAKREAEESSALVAAKDAELSRFKAKTYDEVPKDDHVYICKEASELNTDRHKIGKTIDTKKRESQLNTGSAQGSKIIYERATLNAKVIEDIAHAALKRYHCNREHYNSCVEHSVDILDIACTVVDTLASSYEHISRDSLFNLLIAKLRSIQSHTKLHDKEEHEDVGNDDVKESQEFSLLKAWLGREIEITRNKSNIILLSAIKERYSMTSDQIPPKTFKDCVKAYCSTVDGVNFRKEDKVPLEGGGRKGERNVIRGMKFVE